MTLDQAFREAIALHAIFEAYGIPSADVFVSYGEPHRRFQVVARQGALEFRVDVADLDVDKASFERAWKAAVARYNGLPRRDRVAYTEGAQARESAVRILAGLLLKGFKQRSSAQGEV